MRTQRIEQSPLVEVGQPGSQEDEPVLESEFQVADVMSLPGLACHGYADAGEALLLEPLEERLAEEPAHREDRRGRAALGHP